MDVAAISDSAGLSLDEIEHGEGTLKTERGRKSSSA